MAPKKKKRTRIAENKQFPLPVYKKEDDIYNREKEISLNDEEGIGEPVSARKGKSIDDGLDIPGAELDDRNETIGEEDEENNYYSLGGDNHAGLEEENPAR